MRFINQNTIDYWDEVYDKKDFDGYCYRKRMDIVFSWLGGLNLSKNSMILDAGCGAGRFVVEAAKEGFNIIGLDYSHGMVVKASSLCKNEDDLNVAFLQGDIEAIPLKNSSFDVIVCLGVVGYLKSEDKVLNLLARVLKPGGVLMISIVNKARFVSRLDLPYLLISKVKRMLKGTAASSEKSTQINYDPPLRTFLIPKFRKSLEIAGFRVLEYRTVPLKLLTFCGKEVFPQMMARRITLQFEQFSNIPFIESFGGMCVFLGEKRSLE